QSGTTLVLTALGLVALHELMRPLDGLRRLLLGVLVVMAVGAFGIPFVADFFTLEVPAADQAIPIAVGAVVGGLGIVLAARHEDVIADAVLSVVERVRR
ncbi:MAG TPA: hypothetical protein VFT09_11430, partial [Ilumatobacteraceae bacterium]|nr:hypothetical protein [Ilumatobacteraceae bacterium]